MNRILVWDFPTRIFHWLLTLTVVGALIIAETADDDGSLFQIHMLLGLIGAFLVFLRLVWGLIGAKYARFQSFIFSPKDLVGYIQDVFRHGGRRYIGHNPGSAYAIYAILFLSIGLAFSGALMPTWKAFEEIHEIMANVMILTIALHIAGIVWYTIKHKENISFSMVDGKKPGELTQSIGSSHSTMGIVFLALSIGWTLFVFKNSDFQKRQVTLLGETISLGKSETHESEKRSHDKKHKKSGKDSRHRRDHDERHHSDHDD